MSPKVATNQDSGGSNRWAEERNTPELRNSAATAFSGTDHPGSPCRQCSDLHQHPVPRQTEGVPRLRPAALRLRGRRGAGIGEADSIAPAQIPQLHRRCRCRPGSTRPDQPGVRGVSEVSLRPAALNGIFHPELPQLKADQAGGRLLHPMVCHCPASLRQRAGPLLSQSGATHSSA